MPTVPAVPGPEFLGSRCVFPNTSTASASARGNLDQLAAGVPHTAHVVRAAEKQSHWHQSSVSVWAHVEQVACLRVQKRNRQ